VSIYPTTLQEIRDFRRRAHGLTLVSTIIKESLPALLTPKTDILHISTVTIPFNRTGVESGRKQAGRVLSFLTVCSGCGADATERHHKDGDPFNNHRDNLVQLCGSCHQLAHGKYPRPKEWHGSAVSWAWRHPV
jgi:hypothetical protein